MYTPRQHYTADELARFYLRDLAVDIRFARRNGSPEFAEYAATVTATLRALWPRRHNARITRYGVPE